MGKIRIATKNFLCEKCNQLIKNGESYYDWWNTTSKDNYYHRRFHINCLDNKDKIIDKNKTVSEEKPKKPTLLERLQKRLDEENGCLMMGYKDEKRYVCGIVYGEDGEKKILCETWCDHKPYYETLENFKDYHDWKGDYI